MAWAFFSNHGLALLAVARRPKSRIRDVAVDVGITERAAQSILNDLVRERYLERVREGRRNRYVIRGDLPLRHATTRDHTVGELVAVAGGGAGLAIGGGCEAVVLACGEHQAQPALQAFLGGQGLLSRAELLLWPGGGPALTGPDRDILFPALEMLVAEHRPERVLLLAHGDCRVPNVPRVAAAGVLDVYRSVMRWAGRIVSESIQRIGVAPELWFLSGPGASRVRVASGAAQAARRRQATEGSR